MYKKILIKDILSDFWLSKPKNPELKQFVAHDFKFYGKVGDPFNIFEKEMRVEIGDNWRNVINSQLQLTNGDLNYSLPHLKATYSQVAGTSLAHILDSEPIFSRMPFNILQYNLKEPYPMAFYRVRDTRYFEGAFVYKKLIVFDMIKEKKDRRGVYRHNSPNTEYYMPPLFVLITSISKHSTSMFGVDKGYGWQNTSYSIVGPDWLANLILKILKGKPINLGFELQQIHKLSLNRNTLQSIYWDGLKSILGCFPITDIRNIKMLQALNRSLMVTLDATSNGRVPLLSAMPIEGWHIPFTPQSGSLLSATPSA